MQVGDEFVVMVETTITANGKTIDNPIIRVTRPQAESNPRFVYFIDNQTVGQPRHWYVGDGNGNVVVSDIDVVDSTTSTALATALTDQLTAAGYLSSQHTSTVNDVPASYNRTLSYVREWEFGEFVYLRHDDKYCLGVRCKYIDDDSIFYLQCTLDGVNAVKAYEEAEGIALDAQPTPSLCDGTPMINGSIAPIDGIGLQLLEVFYDSCSLESERQIEWSLYMECANEYKYDTNSTSLTVRTDPSDLDSTILFEGAFEVVDV